MISDLQIESAAKRVMQRCDQVALMSDVAGQTTRTFCCPAMKLVHQSVSQWMQAAVLECHLDSVGNLVGLPKNRVDDPVLLIGSHLDTVVNAGKYDGVLGVLLGLAAAELIQESNLELNFGLAVVGFSEEEGIRFNRPYIGSSAMAGCFDPAVLKLLDAEGCSVESALTKFGCQPKQWATASLAGQNVIGFIEPHIEQGPLLQAESQPVGIVSAIAGQTRATIRILGSAGHAGTVPHHLRRDALAGAAEVVLRIEAIGRETKGLVATVGRLDVQPNASNVVPGEVQLTVDLRHADDSVRQICYQQVCEFIFELAKQRELVPHVEINLDQPAVPLDEKLSESLAAAISESGFQPRRMLSGAGHDAAIMARLAPTAMLFIRCRDGISHHPEEHVELDDVSVALKVLMRTLPRIK